jgi:hypothetical protein
MSEFHQQLVLRLHEELGGRLRADMTQEGEFPPIELRRQGE